LIYFLIYLFIEVSVSLNISSRIGSLATFIELLFSAVVGFMLLANFRYTFFETMQAFMNRTISAEEFQKLNVMSVVGAILLILPGFFSDILGILLQFGFFATLISKRFLHVNSNYDNNKYNSKGDTDVIDVEIIDDTSAK